MVAYSRLLREPATVHGILFVGALVAALVLGSLVSRNSSYATGSAYVRVNQVGYISGETKRAILMATGSVSGATFNVINTANGHSVYSARIGASQGSWSSAFPNTYLLDLTPVQTRGSYTIRVDGPIYAAQCLASGENIFDLAKTSSVGQLLTAAEYDYYPEVEWRDDLELGATELYFATATGKLPPDLPHTDPMYYLQKAAHWARQYMLSPNDGTDSLNLYDVSGLAHYELSHAIAQAGNPGNLEVTRGDLLNDLRHQLVNGTTQAAHDPFGLGIAYGGQDASPHALGYALEAQFYDQLAGVSTYKTFGLTQRNWVLGDNAWGSSFIAGAGSTFPYCMQHQVANLAGSLDGTPPIVLGATVDGPNATASFQGLGLQSGMRKCPPAGGDPFKIFSSKGARYIDNVADWPSVEPSDDYTALGILVFAQQVSLS